MHLFPAFGDMRLDDITVDTLQKFLNDRVNLAKNTVHTMFVLFNEIMDSAFEDRYIQSNPAKSRRITIPSTKKKERQALSPEQLRLIIAQISQKLTDVTERRLMALLLFTGMRRGEVMGLRWEDIDFERRLIAVNRAVSYTTNQPIHLDPQDKEWKARDSAGRPACGFPDASFGDRIRHRRQGAAHADGDPQAVEES